MLSGLSGGDRFFCLFFNLFFIYIIVETMTISLLVAKSHLIVVIDDLVHVFVLLLCFGKSSHLGSLKWPEKTRKKRQFLALFWNFRLFHKTYHGIWRKHFSFYYRQSVPNLWNNSGFSMPYNLHDIEGGLLQFHPPWK